MERVQWRATKTLIERENLTYEEMLVEFNLLNLEDRRIRGNLIILHQYIQYIYGENGGTRFTREQSDKRQQEQVTSAEILSGCKKNIPHSENN